MKTTYKILILYVLSLTTILYVHKNINDFASRSELFQKNILIKQAQVHFDEQINIRHWNASFGGIYIKRTNNLKPNPYLEDNILKVDDNLSLIKINPAWMTRQLSQIQSSKDYSFRITSLKPINPINKSNEFETKALKYFENSKDKEYYEINASKFNYMGALATKKSCLKCHAKQGYKIDDIRGGISITLNTDEYFNVMDSVEERAFRAKVIFTTLLIILTILIHKQLRHSYNLSKMIDSRTHEIYNTKNILQHIIDTDKSFLFVLEDTKMIMANKTMLDFFGYKNVEDFSKEHQHISSMFDEDESELYLQHFMDQEHWVHYLQREQSQKKLKVKLKNNNITKTFKPTSKEISIDNRKLHIVLFDDITDELKHIQKIKDEASKDSLTNLFNRGKFEEILIHEMELANSIKQALSIIFIDIDYFKNINDEHGHDVGDEVLKSLAKILHDNMRYSDSVSRWGGEEFVVLLQATPINESKKIAEKLRTKVSKNNFDTIGHLTISLGVTEYIFDESDKDFIKRADEALYEAKDAGRDKVIVK